MPAWLRELGYEAPPEDKIKIDLAYTTRHYRLKRDRFVLLNPDDILYFSADNGLVKAKTATESYVVPIALPRNGPREIVLKIVLRLDDAA